MNIYAPMKRCFCYWRNCRVPGFLYGITAAAEQQAEIVARYLCGDISKYYSGSLLMNILKMHGTELCSLGLAEIPNNDPTYEEIVFIDKAKRYYKKCIVHNDKLVGAILIGDKSEFLEYRNLIENKLELSEKRYSCYAVVTQLNR